MVDGGRTFAGSQSQQVSLKFPSLLLLLLIFLLAEFPPSFVFPSLLGTSIKRLHLLEWPLAFRRKSKPRFLELKFSRRHLFYYYYGNFLNVDPPKPPRPSLIFAATGTDKKEQLSMTQKNWSSDENVAPTPKKGGRGARLLQRAFFVVIHLSLSHIILSQKKGATY